MLPVLVAEHSARLSRLLLELVRRFGLHALISTPKQAPAKNSKSVGGARERFLLSNGNLQPGVRPDAGAPFFGIGINFKPPHTYPNLDGKGL